MTVAIVDYGSGNLRSVEKSFERAARGLGNGQRIVVTRDPSVVRDADRIVLPGVGSFKDCRDGLMSLPGMWQALDETVQVSAKPFMGICVGMQLMASRGLEHCETAGFNWMSGDVIRINPNDLALKVPHMGWNTVKLRKQHPLFENIQLGDAGLHAYFVHSYHFLPHDQDCVVLEADYGGFLTAAVAARNMFGTQFHPEKSQRLGLALIANFLQWQP